MSLTHKEYLNCYIVQNGGREGYLFQPIDYCEYSHDSIIIKNKLEIIKQTFPDLKHTKCQQGIMISKLEYNDDYLDNNINLANILSYCCPITHTETSVKYSYDIVVKLKNDAKINIISYICDNGRCDRYAYNQSIKFKNILFNLDYVEDVVFIKNIHYNEAYYINLLSKYERELTITELDEINNYLYNLGFSEKLQDYIQYNMEFNNPVHRGILIGLLTQSKCNILEPFFPLQNYPNESKYVNIQTSKWEELLIKTLNLSKSNQQ